VALAPLAGDRLAVASGAKVAILSRKDGSASQEPLELNETVTCLASDPTGQWLVVGTNKGLVAVFECETDATRFQQSDAEPLHEAAVTALLFETEELRFLSAGADQKLLSTHARGRLEAEDRGRGANHEEPITGLVNGPAQRVYSGSRDASLKSWPPGKGTRPVTLEEGMAKVVGVATVQVHNRWQVVAACEDNTLRFFHLDGEGRFGDPASLVHGVDDWARNEFRQDDPKRREAALKTLAGFADAESVKRIYNEMNHDADHELRLLACKLLTESPHPRASRALEKALDHNDDKVRITAFEGLRKRSGPQDIRTLALALKAGRADIGERAVHGLEALAGKDDQAMARLVNVLQAKAPEVRKAALASLERLHGARSPEASLTALGSRHADLRRLALLRLYRRDLLGDPRVQAALRWRGEDEDPEVRRVAFLLSLYTRDKLLEALRTRDQELGRQLVELEGAAAETGPVTVAAAASAGLGGVIDKLASAVGKKSEGKK
jgi:ParB family chromosome partitioning protein